MERLIPRVINWAEDRNIINGSSLEKETLKLISKCAKLTDFINKNEICTRAIGHCIVQMIIICRMQNISLDESIKFTKTITDERITDPRISSLFVFKTIGKLGENVILKKDVKIEIGYLLIYLTALATSLQQSIKECTEHAFQEIEDYEGIMYGGEFIEYPHENYPHALSITRSRESRD